MCGCNSSDEKKYVLCMQLEGGAGSKSERSAKYKGVVNMDLTDLGPCNLTDLFPAAMLEDADKIMFQVGEAAMYYLPYCVHPDLDPKTEGFAVGPGCITECFGDFCQFQICVEGEVIIHVMKEVK